MSAKKNAVVNVVTSTGTRRLRPAAWARELAISRGTMWHWVAHLGLRVSRIGRITLVDERDLNSFMERHAVQTSSKIK